MATRYRDRPTIGRLGILGTLTLLAIGLLGCEPGLVVNERFVPTTVGIVAGSDRVVVNGEERRRYGLADGRAVDVAIADLAPFDDAVPPGDLLLMGTEPTPWVIRGVGGGDGNRFVLGGRAIDRGSTIEIEMDRERGLFLVVPKAPNYDDYGSTSEGEELFHAALDDQGRALGPDY